MIFADFLYLAQAINKRSKMTPPAAIPIIAPLLKLSDLIVVDKVVIVGVCGYLVLDGLIDGSNVGDAVGPYV